MATRSAIAVKNLDGTVTSVYCHSDGYPSHNGALLLNHYNDLEKAQNIVALGGVSFLDENIAPINEFDNPRYGWRSSDKVKHSFDTPQKGVSTFYHRDRGEELEIYTHQNEDDFISFWKGDVDYLYLWKDDKWHVDGSELTKEMTID